MIENTDGQFQIKFFIIHVLLHAGAIAALFYFTPLNLLTMLIVHYVLIGLGISVGFHRMFAHKSIKTFPIVETFFAFLGTLAFQSGPITWVTIHRAHHANSDGIGDAHAANRGFLWAHYRWMLFRNPNGFSLVKYWKMVKDLTSKPHILFFEKHALAINLLAIAIGYLLLPLDLFLWVFPMRIVFTWHLTWSINSIAHNVFPFIKPKAINNPINSNVLALFTFGEGLHLNHHKQPSSCFFDTNKFEFDLARPFLKIFEKVGVFQLIYKKPIDHKATS